MYLEQVAGAEEAGSDVTHASCYVCQRYHSAGVGSTDPCRDDQTGWPRVILARVLLASQCPTRKPDQAGNGYERSRHTSEVGRGGADRKISSSGDINSPDSTPRLRSGRSARISDGNRDGNDGSRQRPEAAANSHVLSHVQRELGNRYT